MAELISFNGHIIYHISFKSMDMDIGMILCNWAHPYAIITLQISFIYFDLNFVVVNQFGFLFHSLSPLCTPCSTSKRDPWASLILVAFMTRGMTVFTLHLFPRLTKFQGPKRSPPLLVYYYLHQSRS